jgi:hypothetical protein
LFTGLGFRNDEDVDRPVSLPGSADNKLTKFSNMDKPPASKKRRVENDELWGDDDDDFELTQKDLENIDCEVMASQSTKNGTTTHHPCQVVLVNAIFYKIVTYLSIKNYQIYSQMK